MLRLLAGCFIVLLLYLSPAHAAVQPAKPAHTLKSDSSSITAAKFDREAIRDFKDQKEFQYDDVQTRQLSLWDRFWMIFWDLIGRLFVGAASNTLSRYFFIGAGVALLIYIMIKVIGADKIFSKQPRETILPYDVITENIHEIDYEQELARLINDGKFRLAVRLLYLQSLKKLSDAQVILWQPDKTNYHYLTEINKPELREDFSRLTRQFDYIWYGDFPVNSDKFGSINQLFNEFKSRIR